MKIGDQGFHEKFRAICQLDSMPCMELGYIKKLKAEFLDTLIQREVVQSIGNAARLIASWLDAVLEYTVLKHEALFLTVKKTSVIQRIQDISTKWPIKKQFIESAYKLLLFTKRVKPEITLVANWQWAPLDMVPELLKYDE